jgi:hypothetical protein
MAGNKLTIKLTEDQQRQIMKASGRNITELNIDVATADHLTQKDLDNVSGGTATIKFEN